MPLLREASVADVAWTAGPRGRMTPVILAVDLGKTSCRAAAAGRRAEGAGAPGLATPDGVRAAEAAILAVARELGPVDEVIVGAAGALAAPDAARALGHALLASLRAERVAVTSDAVIAHAGALNGQPGVVLIVGTGVVALAIDADGALRTADGWGPWLGDEGGGAWIGAAGLRAALRAHDGRGPSTTLLDAARARFGAPRTWPAQLTDAAALASFAPDVLAAQDDAAALQIVSPSRRRARRDRPRGRGWPGGDRRRASGESRRCASSSTSSRPPATRSTARCGWGRSTSRT